MEDEQMKISTRGVVEPECNVGRQSSQARQVICVVKRSVQSHTAGDSLNEGS